MTPNDNTYRQPDEGTPDDAPVWAYVPNIDTDVNGDGGASMDWELSRYDDVDETAVFVVLARENQGPPSEGWRPE